MTKPTPHKTSDHAAPALLRRVRCLVSVSAILALLWSLPAGAQEGEGEGEGEEGVEALGGAESDATISTEVACEGVGGVWVDDIVDGSGDPFGDEAFEDEDLGDFRFDDGGSAHGSRGCEVDGQREGVWITVMGGKIILSEEYDGGVLDGPSFAFHDNGSVSSQSTYANGKQEGQLQLWSPAGRVLAIFDYEDGKKHGDSIEFHSNCLKATVGQWKEGQRHGKWARWTRRGIPVDEGTYVEGRQEGMWRFFDPEGGQLIREGPFLEDLEEGTFKEWSANGTFWREVEFKEGMRQGPGLDDCRDEEGYWQVDYVERLEGCEIGGMKSGTWYKSFPGGAIQTKYPYVEDQLTGELTDYHPTGEVLRTGEYVDGVPNGTHHFVTAAGDDIGTSSIVGGTGQWSRWDHNGVLRERGKYVEGKREGLWQVWGPDSNKLEETEYRDGLRDGVYRDWYDTGEFSVSGGYTADKRSGLWTAYYKNGNAAWSGNYSENGYRTGEWVEFYWSGLIERSGTFSEDWENGMWTEYYEEGQIRGRGPYKDGLKHGTWVEFWPTGEKWREVEYEAGVELSEETRVCTEIEGNWNVDYESRRVGCQVCRPKGYEVPVPTPLDVDVSEEAREVSLADLRASETMSVGEILETAEDRPDALPGDVDPNAPDQLEAGIWVWYHPNGKRERAGRFLTGERHGEWRFWFDNGQERMAGEYARGIQDGAWVGWYENGNKRFEGAYSLGNPQGEWSQYHEDGKPSSRGEFEQGVRHGKWTYFHRNGAASSSGEFADGEETGEWTELYPTGEKKADGRYEGGRRAGTWTWYRKDGSVWRTAEYGEDGREKL